MPHRLQERSDADANPCDVAPQSNRHRDYTWILYLGGLAPIFNAPHSHGCEGRGEVRVPDAGARGWMLYPIMLEKPELGAKAQRNHFRSQVPRELASRRQTWSVQSGCNEKQARETRGRRREGGTRETMSPRADRICHTAPAFRGGVLPHYLLAESQRQWHPAEEFVKGLWGQCFRESPVIGHAASAVHLTRGRPAVTHD